MRQEVAADSDLAQGVCKALNELQAVCYGVRDGKKINTVLFELKSDVTMSCQSTRLNIPEDLSLT
jgi:hypothetical protein